MSTVKQVIVLRRDLYKAGPGDMAGKMAAQAAHAALAILLNHGYQEYGPKAEPIFCFEMWPELRTWIEQSFTKVVLGCDSEAEMLDLHKAALAAKLHTVLIQDEGRTKFKGVPTVTALGIGPEDADALNKITGHLKLL